MSYFILGLLLGIGVSALLVWLVFLAVVYDDVQHYHKER